MVEKKQAAEAAEAVGELRGTLIKRLAVAGGLVAVLLGVLAFFDYLTSPEEPEHPVFTQPVPVPPKKEVSQPVKPAEPSPEPAKPENPPAPEKTVEPPAAAESLPKPEVPARPAATVSQPEAKIPPKPVPPRSSVAKPMPYVTQPESTAAPVVRMPGEAKVAAPAAKPVESVAAVQPPPTPLRLFSGLMLQAGVFTSVERAEELHAKLTLNGIPSVLEARVQAGPFKNRKEAAAAQEKMQALGIRAVVISPKGSR